VSRSGYYAWAARGPSARAVSDAVMTDRIRGIHSDSDATYGSRRVHAQLVRDGVVVNVKRVARLMRVSEIVGAHVPAKRRRAAGDGILGVEGVKNGHLPSLSGTVTTVQPDKSNLVHRSGGTSVSTVARSRDTTKPLRSSPWTQTPLRAPAANFRPTVVLPAPAGPFSKTTIDSPAIVMPPEAIAGVAERSSERLATGGQKQASALPGLAFAVARLREDAEPLGRHGCGGAIRLTASVRLQ
jgi:hypothetical protein